MDMNLIQFLSDNYKDILYGLSAIVAFLAGRKTKVANTKKAVAEATGAELENVETALKIYRDMLSDMENKLKEAKEAYIVIETRYQIVIKEKRELKKENEFLKTRLNEISSVNK